LNTNDRITLVISGLAFAVSVVTWYIGQKEQRKQMRAGVREQLSKVVQDLIAAQGELWECQDAMSGGKAVSKAETGSINHRLTSLARQACELIKLEEDVGFDVEYIAIANALMTSGDLPAAELYFLTAIKKSPSDYYHAMNLTMFASFLFSVGRADDGRQAYTNAVSLLPDTNDFNREMNARTYQSWADGERWYSSPKEDGAGKCLAKAKEFILAIGFEPKREGLLRELEMQAASFRQPPAVPGQPRTQGRNHGLNLDRPPAARSGQAPFHS
jgi:tetratricopeptide (TPR) repeat protein